MTVQEAEISALTQATWVFMALLVLLFLGYNLFQHIQRWRYGLLGNRDRGLGDGEDWADPVAGEPQGDLAEAMGLDDIMDSIRGHDPDFSTHPLFITRDGVCVQLLGHSRDGIRSWSLRIKVTVLGPDPATLRPLGLGIRCGNRTSVALVPPGLCSETPILPGDARVYMVSLWGGILPLNSVVAVFRHGDGTDTAPMELFREPLVAGELNSV